MRRCKPRCGRSAAFAATGLSCRARTAKIQNPMPCNVRRRRRRPDRQGQSGVVGAKDWLGAVPATFAGAMVTVAKTGTRPPCTWRRWQGSEIPDRTPCNLARWRGSKIPDKTPCNLARARGGRAGPADRQPRRGVLGLRPTRAMAAHANFSDSMPCLACHRALVPVVRPAPRPGAPGGAAALRRRWLDSVPRRQIDDQLGKLVGAARAFGVPGRQPRQPCGTRGSVRTIPAFS